MKLSPLFFSLLFTSVSFAQVSEDPSLNTLEMARVKAEANLISAASCSKDEINKSEGYNPCLNKSLEIQQKYDSWFIAHYSEFTDLSQKVDAMIMDANTQISKVKKKPILTVPMQGQTASEVEVDFNTMIEYFKIYNGRLKTCAPEMKEQLILDMNKPENNKFNVAHTQIVAAMQKFTVLLNASLKELSATYELSFAQSGNSYSLNLLVKSVENPKIKYRFSLLDAHLNSEGGFTLTEDKKWKSINEAGITIDHYAVDGLKRYRSFIDQNQEKCGQLCKEIPSVSSNSPYFTHADAVAYIDTLKKSGELDVILKAQTPKATQKPSQSTRTSERSQQRLTRVNNSEYLCQDLRRADPHRVFQEGLRHNIGRCRIRDDFGRLRLYFVSDSGNTESTPACSPNDAVLTLIRLACGGYCSSF